jgi:membrane-associated protein
MVATLFDWIFHLDIHLATLTAQHGVWVYLMLAAVIFVETGLVIMPFLLGDSLLFVAGALAAGGALTLAAPVASLAVAAIAGDTANYAIGSYFRKRVEQGSKLHLIKPAHLKKTQEFFDRHGRKTIILARFVPVVRTLAPFVAAVGRMPYGVFLTFNVVGGVIWVAALTVAGYLFGQVYWIQKNLTVALLGIVGLSILPGVIGWLRSKKA